MRNHEKKAVIKLSIFVPLAIIVMTIFSLPLMGIPPLGNLLFPGNGVWKVPGELPAAERLNIPGLRGEVNVIRDEWGIPHIFAEYEEDLFFAQGYCHAQDRLFQMDMYRRQVRGGLSEILGESMITSDKIALARGMEDSAIRTDRLLREMYSNGTLEFFSSFERYIDGINYYIESLNDFKPLEYHLTNFKPTKWTSIDTLCIVQEMARQMSWTYDDLERYVTLQALNSTYYNELFGDPLPYQIPIVPDYGDYPQSPMKAGINLKANYALKTEILNLLESIQEIESEKTLIENQKEQIIGSNNWVVNSNLSNTGAPILCNDMHLAWLMPGVMYEQHLKAEDTGFHVYGFNIPGLPGVAVGHNERVGWGFTNTGYDVIDWYYYNKDGPNNYIYDGVSTAYTHKNYDIKVKDQKTVEFIVNYTVHGPVFSDFIDFGLSSSLGNIVIAPKWTAHGYFFNILAGNGFVRANNRAEFDEGSKDWTLLAQNIVYADVDGNIAIRPTGKVPIRDDSKIPPGHFGNGSLPYNGSNGEGEWVGYVPFEELPNSLNPSQNYLASANQLVVGPEYKKYFLQHGYANGYRARRINELLSNAVEGSVSVEIMKNIQNDVNSTAARAFIPELIEVINDYYIPSIPTKINNVLTVLENWGFIMDKDESAPTIYRKWRDYFQDFTFDDESSLYGKNIGSRIVVLEYLMKENESSHWFNDVSTPENETRDDIMMKALNATIAWLEVFYKSENPVTWRWGDLHQLYFTSLTQLDSLSRGPYEANGEGYTINPSGVNIDNGVGFARGGASERLIIDFSNLNNSLSVIPSGQRGLSNSKHYSDQLEQLFLQGKYHYQYFTNTAYNFPTSAIESKLFFFPTGG
ncbi:MAG: penicillin acylase family protein [Candidatus Lokiarchaeota archaeon]|nr:penicillin acylase family protein [Candidatus Lokiarchaeota archaeon]